MSTPTSVRGTLARIAQIILGIGIIVLATIEIASYRNSGGVIVADPAKPFYPNQSGKSSYLDTLLHSPLAAVVAGLIVVLIGITVFRATHMSKKFGEFAGTLWPLVTVLVVVFVGFGFVAPFLASPSSDDTFSTWAKERYGIEIEAYPKLSGGINTSETVTLDNGNKIKFREVLDARGNRAYVITDTGRVELSRVDVPDAKKI